MLPASAMHEIRRCFRHPPAALLERSACRCEAGPNGAARRADPTPRRFQKRRHGRSNEINLNAFITAFGEEPCVKSMASRVSLPTYPCSSPLKLSLRFFSNSSASYSCVRRIVAMQYLAKKPAFRLRFIFDKLCATLNIGSLLPDVAAPQPELNV